MSKVLVLVPTYNEAGNIGKLLDKLMNLDIAGKLDVLVRDDKSPDGTASIVQKFAKMKKYKGRIFLEEGQKKGLGVAMRSSFDSIIKNYDHDIIVTMDADFSHDPNDVVKLVDTINEGADVAIGSRYTAGGLIPGDWPLFWLVRTHVATHVARWLGGIDEDVKELTTNMRAIKRDVLTQIDYNRIELTGYAFQIMLANELTRREWNVVEVPIAFRSRLEGQTKSRFVDILEFFQVAYQLNPDSPAKQTLRFMFIGGTGSVVNLVSLFALASIFSSNAAVLSLASIQISIVWNFFWHSKFTFRSRERTDKGRLFSLSTLSDLSKYELSASLTQLLTLSVFVTLNSAGIYFLLAQFMGIVAAFMINYYVSKTYIWSSKKVNQLSN